MTTQEMSPGELDVRTGIIKQLIDLREARGKFGVPLPIEFYMVMIARNENPCPTCLGDRGERIAHHLPGAIEVEFIGCSTCDSTGLVAR